MKTFFRHFSLYEFSFKPRRELVLKSEPFLNRRFNAELSDLNEMTQLEPEEAERLKGYLHILQQDPNISALDQEMDPTASLTAVGHSATEAMPSAMGVTSQESIKPEPTVDWSRVGRPYKATDPIESVIEREMARLKVAMDKKIAVQDVELEERILVARGKKK